MIALKFIGCCLVGFLIFTSFSILVDPTSFVYTGTDYLIEWINH